MCGNMMSGCRENAAWPERQVYYIEGLIDRLITQSVAPWQLLFWKPKGFHLIWLRNVHADNLETEMVRPGLILISDDAITQKLMFFLFPLPNVSMFSVFLSFPVSVFPQYGKERKRGKVKIKIGLVMQDDIFFFFHCDNSMKSIQWPFAKQLPWQLLSSHSLETIMLHHVTSDSRPSCCCSKSDTRHLEFEKVCVFIFGMGLT